ncbi:MAG: hypothetical protein DYH15_14450 [Nitrosomonas sp. PRO4]|nr:hypothetical protein [Nitrosomonas sp. PRO4]
MTNKWGIMTNPKLFRENISSNLRRIAEFLNRKGVINDVSPLYKAASQCLNRGGDLWGYRIERLIFHKVGEIRVQSHKISSISLEVNVDIEGVCNIDIGYDPLTKLSLDLSIMADCNEEEGLAPMSAWHLDRHSQDANFSHPSYHFQFGGNRMKYDHGQYGLVLITDSPRIPHPPMDGILGIDFAIINFWEVEKIRFRNEGEYTNLLSESINMLWKPYVENLHNYWQQNAQLLQWKPHINWHQLPPKAI